MATIGRKEQRKKVSVMIFLMALGSFILHLAVSENYQIHKDAFLYLNYAENPAWGYIDFPPFIMVLASISVKIFGGSAFAVRFFPALASSLMVGFLGIIIKDIGGRKWAVLLGTLAFALSPAFLRLGGLFQPTSFNVMFWFFYFYLFVQMLRTENYNYWYLIGLITGFGFLNQYTMGIPLFFTVIALLISGKFSAIFTRQFWIGIIGVAVIISPNILWQYNHNWPIFYYLQELNATQFLSSEPAHFLSMQFIMNSPSALIWLSGLIGIIIFKPFRRYISIALSFFFMLIFLVYFNAKPHYMLGVYPILFAFGAYGLELLTWKYKWTMPSITLIVSTIALFFLPLGMPLVQKKAMAKYSNFIKSIGINTPFVWDNGDVEEIPQDYAEMLGYKELTQLAVSAYESLSEEDQKNVGFYSPDQGIVGALNYYNRKTSIHRAYSFKGSYMFLTPQYLSSDLVLILVAKNPEELNEYFGTKELFGALDVQYSKDNGASVVILKNPIPQFFEDYKGKRDGLFSKFKRKQN